jgi:threonyl-tRNA synthetase
VYDALKRKFQCATVQLDFQLPIRFNLTYMTDTNTTERPVIVHRAVLGSVERMLAILTEHFAGKWPLWLSPRQVMVVPISEASYDYALKVGRGGGEDGAGHDVTDWLLVEAGDEGEEM